MSSGGLLRYRSAPSSLLVELCDDFLPARFSSPDTAADVAILDRFLAQDVQFRDDVPFGVGGAATGQRAPQFTASALAERRGAALFSPASQQMMMLHSQQNQQQQQQLARKLEQMKNGGGAASGSSNLVRHSSSPAGLFSHLNADLGYQPNFSSRQNPITSQISEAVIAGSSSDESNWENSSRGKNIVDDLNPAEVIELSNHVPPLTHPFSLPPKPSPETAAMENYLHFHDSVTCKLRAKRGCATHPRSIAEREFSQVRRTRISERIKKLQELVPNMDTQTNTADMLDLSISYIKDLQKQVQRLSESRSSCTCSSGN